MDTPIKPVTVYEASKGFLTPEEMLRLTGWTQISKQKTWLEEHRFIHIINGRGELLVLWEHVREKLCTNTGFEEEVVQPNFEAVFEPLRQRKQKIEENRRKREQQEKAKR